MNLSGRRFGYLVARSSLRVPVGQTGRRVVKWVCECDCGNLSNVYTHYLTSGHTKSCGCLSTKLTKTGQHWNRTHGQSQTKLYRVWWSMITRCEQPNVSTYRHYGGRGIKVCDRWRYGENGQSGFECFLSDMGPRPDGFWIDRTNNDGNYEPSNCRWVTPSEQCLTRRGPTRTKSNRTDAND